MRVLWASRTRMPAVLLGLLAACASTSELPMDPFDGGGSALPQADGSTEPDAGIAEATTPDASDAQVAPRICSDDDFCHSAVAPGTHFRGLWGDGTGVLWAVTLEQNVLRWDGAAWNVHYQSATPVTAIWGTSPTELWVVTSTGLLHGTGASSAQVAFAPSGYLPGEQAAPLRSVWGSSSLDAWAVGGVEPTLDEMRGRVLRYGDDPDLGLGWHLDLELSAQPISFHGVWGTPETGVWLHGVSRAGIGRKVGILHRPPGATAWTSVVLPELSGANPQLEVISGVGTTSDKSVWLIGELVTAQTVFVHGTESDAGTTFDWRYRATDPARPPYAMWGLGGDDIWAAGKSGLVTHWDGAKWTQAAIRVNNFAVTRNFRAIWGTSNDDFWVVGDEIAIHRTHAGKP